jgi:hypothetical protein
VPTGVTASDVLWLPHRLKVDPLGAQPDPAKMVDLGKGINSNAFRQCVSKAVHLDESPINPDYPIPAYVRWALPDQAGAEDGTAKPVVGDGRWNRC